MFLDIVNYSSLKKKKELRGDGFLNDISTEEVIEGCLDHDEARILYNIIEQAKKNLRFIHWSSCGVYGEPKYEYNKKSKYVIPCDETSPFNPLDYYEISKVEQEGVLNKFCNEKGLKATILRPAPIFGPYQMYGIYHILLLLKVVGHGIELLLHPRKHRLMFPSIHVRDSVRAAIFLSKVDDCIGEAYNIVNDMVWMDEWLEFLNQKLGIRSTTLPVWFPLFTLFSKVFVWIAKIRNRKARKLGIRPILDTPMVEYITQQFAYSNQKLKNLGFKFKYDTWTGFSQTIDWYYKHGWLPTEQNKMQVF